MGGVRVIARVGSVNVAEGTHVDSLEVALRQVASQIPKNIIGFLWF